MIHSRVFEKIDTTNGVILICLVEDLFDQLNIVSMREQLLEFVERNRPRRVLVSFDRVRKYGSEAIGILLDAAKRVRSQGGDIRLCSMSASIREIFEVCDLIPRKFYLFNSSAEGIASFDHGAS